MSGFLVFLLFSAVLAVGGFFLKKTEADSTPMKRSQDAFKQVGHTWDSSDVEKRAKLLGNIEGLEDDRVFLAIVHAPWSQLPESTRVRLFEIWCKRDVENHRVEIAAKGIGEAISTMRFSEAHFDSIFGNQEEEYLRVTGGVPGFDVAFWPRRIPRGLVRCPECHEYRGVVLNEDLPYPERVEGKFHAVLCICDGVECCECKRRFHRPRSVFWDEATSRIVKSNWCVSTRWTTGVGRNPDEARWPCNDCRRRLGPPLHVSQTGETR